MTFRKAVENDAGIFQKEVTMAGHTVLSATSHPGRGGLQRAAYLEQTGQGLKAHKSGYFKY